MKLSEFVKRVQLETSMDDPSIMFITYQSQVFVINKGGATLNITHRKNYYDESAYGNKVKKGNYFIIEVEE